MTPDQVAVSYDQIAERWSNGRFEARNGVAQHERALSFTAERAGRALDVGCGASGRFIELLLTRGFEPEGLDISSEMLRHARARHPRVTFHQADICKWVPVYAYTFITAWDSIWHVPLAEQKSVLVKLCSALAPRGVFIFSAGGLEVPDERVDQHMGVPMYHATMGVPGICAALQNCGCALKHFEYDQYPQAHVYFIVQRT